MNDLNNSVQSILKSAAGSFLASDYTSALEELKKGEVLDKDNPEILYNLGIAYTRLGLFKTALEYFNRVIMLKFQFIDLLHVKKNIAFCMINLSQYDEALKILENILQDFPSDVPALNMKGYTLEKKGNINDSIRAYSEVFKFDKTNLNSMNSTAYLMAKTGINIKKALEIAEYVFRRDRNNPAYRDTLGYIYLKTGNYEQAEKHLSAAFKEMPFSEEIASHIEELKTKFKTNP
jgi:tetratricopeptide (TPR) repeat protein